MIVALRPDAPAGRVRSELRRLGLWCVEMHDRDGGTSFYVEPHSRSIDRASLEALDGVARVYAPESAHPMLDRQGPVVDVSGVRVGASG